MSLADGWAAINLERPARIPRTEYSVFGHYPLMSAVTGIPVTMDSPNDLKWKACQAFGKAWEIDLQWNTLIGGGDFKSNRRTSMGHAVYAEGGTDWNPNVFCPFKDPEEVYAYDFWQEFGPRDQAELKRRFEEHYRGSCQAWPECVNMTGVYTTVISGLIDIFGWDMLLLAMGTDPKRFGDVTNRYSLWIQQYFDALAAAEGVPVVMIHDDMVWTEGPFCSPAWYRQYVFPNLKRQLAPIVESGKKILFTSDGDYTMFIDDIAACGVSGFVLEPLTDLEVLVRKYGQTHVIIGNADTRILLMGTRPEIRAEVKRCMDLGRNCPGFFLAVGNHIPPNTPVDNAIYYNDCYLKLCHR